MAAQAAGQGTFRIASGQLQGSRKRQEDAYATLTAGAYLVALVADGMGGHLHGDLASRAAVNAVLANFLEAAASEKPYDPRARLRQCVLDAHRAVSKLGEGLLQWNTPGSTLSAVVLEPDTRRMHLATVGDSPILLLRDGVVETLAGWGEADGTLLFCLGGDIGGKAATGIVSSEAPVELQPGDRVLIASDGIFTLGEAVLIEALSADTSRTVVEQLLSRVIAADEPEQDNCTVVLIDVL